MNQDSRLAAALRECEEALRDLCQRAEDGDTWMYAANRVRATIARYGDLREAAGRLGQAIADEILWRSSRDSRVTLGEMKGVIDRLRREMENPR